MLGVAYCAEITPSPRADTLTPTGGRIIAPWNPAVSLIHYVPAAPANEPVLSTHGAIASATHDTAVIAGSVRLSRSNEPHLLVC